jgi:hypothetical protein
VVARDRRFALTLLLWGEETNRLRALEKNCAVYFLSCCRK